MCVPIWLGKEKYILFELSPFDIWLVVLITKEFLPPPYIGVFSSKKYDKNIKFFKIYLISICFAFSKISEFEAKTSYL